jgi:hypothetical protein
MTTTAKQTSTMPSENSEKTRHSSVLIAQIARTTKATMAMIFSAAPCFRASYSLSRRLVHRRGAARPARPAKLC